MRWVGVKWETEGGRRRTEQCREQGPGERGRETLRWRQRGAENGPDPERVPETGEKQGVGRTAQMCGEAGGTKGRPCFL